MRRVWLVGGALVAPWLVCASAMMACGGKVGAGSSGSGSSSGDVGGSGSDAGATHVDASGSSSGGSSGSGSGGVGSSSGSGGTSDGGAVVDASFPGYSLGPDCHPAQVPGCGAKDLAFACAGDAAAAANSFYLPQPTLCPPPTTDPSTGETLYCCLNQCGPDPTVSCDPGTDGTTCMGGSVPIPYSGTVCSTASPRPDGNRAYCCATLGTGSMCKQDTAVQGCVYPSIGFACSGAEAPDQGDPALICSAPTIDPKSGDALYCCQ